MIKLIKYLKPFVLSIILIISLLYVQAMCDLSLPDYMSKIVNVGIQQGGIENAVPKAIRKSEMEKIKLFMSQEEKAEIDNNYKLVDKQSTAQSEYEGYLKDYPILEKEAIYVLNTKNKAETDNLNKIFAKPMLIVSQIEKNGLTMPTGQGNQPAAQGAQPTAQGSQQPTQGTQPATQGTQQPAQGTQQPAAQGAQQAGAGMAAIPANTDPFLILSKMPSQQLDVIKDKANETMKEMPDSMITQGAVQYVHSEYDAVGIKTDKLQSNYILFAGFLMIMIALLSTAATVVVSFLASRVAASLGRNLRKNVFEKVVSFSNSEFDKLSTSTLITRSTNDIQQVQMLMVMLLRIVFYAPILGVGGVIKVLNTDTSMGWIIAVAVMAILTLVLVLFGVAIPKFKSIQKLVDRLNLVTRESLVGMMVIRAFNTQKYEENRFDIANNNLTKTNLFVTRIMSTMFPLMMLIMNLITILIVWVGAHQVDSGAMQVGNMMAFIQYTMQIIMSFLMISMVSMMLPRASVSAQRIAEVIDTEISISDPKVTKSFDQGKKGLIEFKNVSFKYPNAEEEVLSNITFTAKPGQTTAFIGSTGSGKTTLINLIPRFYDITSGELLVDGVDIRQVTQHDLREKIGYVPQKGLLFSGTIDSNLRYGKKEATEEEITKAAEIAQAMEFISTKEKGFETEISQGGNNVSGGQKQRLSIARALTKKPEIFIFDDSFSALDFKTDAELRKALKREISDSTILIVTQRISTVMTAEQIVVLDEGKIVGIGTHKELLENCEVYQQIALSQLSKEELVS